MDKKVVIFWLWWQWKQFLSYFIKKKYSVIWICKSEKTKESIENIYKIKVFTDYKKVLSNDIFLLVLCAYPVDIYDEVISYSRKYNYKILSDLPISFNKDKIQSYWNIQRLFFFIMETKLFFFKYLKKNLHKVKKVNCIIYINKNNLSKQKFKKESIMVDTHYCLNNLLWINLDLLEIKYKLKLDTIKDVEYIIEVLFFDWFKWIYKYEDGRWIMLIKNKKGLTQEVFNNRIFFDNVMNEYIRDIFNWNNYYKKEYINNFIFLIEKLGYEKN